MVLSSNGTTPALREPSPATTLPPRPTAASCNSTSPNDEVVGFADGRKKRRNPEVVQASAPDFLKPFPSRHVSALAIQRPLTHGRPELRQETPEANRRILGGWNDPGRVCRGAIGHRASVSRASRRAGKKPQRLPATPNPRYRAIRGARANGFNVSVRPGPTAGGTGPIRLRTASVGRLPARRHAGHAGVDLGFD